MVLVSALSALIVLTVPMLVLLSTSTIDRLIARNLVEATQAFFVADSGIEWAFNLLVNASDWSVGLLGPGGSPATLVPPPQLLSWGTATITVRDGGNADEVVVTSTGRVNLAERTVQATVRRIPQPSPGAPPAAQGIFARHLLVDWRER